MGLTVFFTVVDKAAVKDRVSEKQYNCKFNSDLRTGKLAATVNVIDIDAVSAFTKRELVFRKNYFARDLVEIITRVYADQCINVVVDPRAILKIVDEVTEAIKQPAPVYHSEILDKDEVSDFVKNIVEFLADFDEESELLVHMFT